MEYIYKTAIPTADGEKTIAVCNCDITRFGERIDILTASAFRHSYCPTPHSLFGALDRVGISAESLAARPFIDLREPCNVWLSQAIDSTSVQIGRLGCIEASYNYSDEKFCVDEAALLRSIGAYFHMLDIAATYGVAMDTVALPLLTSGNQRVSASLVMMPIINECIRFLKRNPSVRRIYFIERSDEKSALIARSLRDSYLLAAEQSAQIQPEPPALRDTLAFISYSSPDKNIADNLCAKLEQRGVRVWYAPRDVVGPYAGAITLALRRATHFVLILSQNSMGSQHVLNEVDLAFQNLPDKIKFRPLRLDESLFNPSMEYYLSRQHWMDAFNPPLEARLDEFADKLSLDL